MRDVMPITSILLYVDTTDATDDRVEVAVRLAQRFDAYLIATGLEEAAVGPKDRFMRTLKQEQLLGEWQTIVGLPSSYMARYAAGSDLVVIGQHNPDQSSGLDKPADVVLGCGRPVLVVPYFGLLPYNIVDGQVLVAWNGSREVQRAVQEALPILGLAKGITVLSVNPEEDADIVLQAEMVAHLERHGLAAIPETIRTDSLATADIVLDRAKEITADLVVMGAYGHSRLRETFLGGMTHDMLRDTTRPLLISH
jgi:nucleotide-binding universal stress UspA family protein